MLPKIKKRLRPGGLVLAALVLLSAVTLLACTAAPSRGWSGPMVDGNILYVGTIDGQVVALDLTEGEPDLAWAKDIGVDTGGGGFLNCGRVSQPMGIYGVPLVKDGKLYVGGYDGDVLYIRIDDGSMSDRFETRGAIAGSLVADEERLYVGSADGRLYALSLDLREEWSFKTGDKIWSDAVVSDGVVYIGSADHRLYALEAESGTEIWHFEADGAIMSTPLVHEGTVYIGACDRKFYAVEAATEDERLEALGRPDGEAAPERGASHVFDGAGNWFWTKALVHNGEIWVGCLDHRVYCLDAASLEKIRDYETEGMVYAPPLLVEGRIIVGSQDGNVYSIDPEDKGAAAEILNSFDAPILAPLYADSVNGIVYVHAQNGEHTLYAVRVASGEVVWSYRTDNVSE
jgi:outer membrane protein assembly factor BamB